MSKVTVILPVFNARPFLAVALASLLGQSHRNLELIAIDDGSTDRSATILRAAAEIDPRVTVISRPNRGLIATLNEGLAQADSDFVARMDADDIAYPDRIAVQLAHFDQDSRLGLLGTNFDTLFTADRVQPAAEPILTAPGERAILGRFVTPLRHPTVMFCRTRLGAGRLAYDPAYPCAEDFDLFRRLAQTTGIAETAAPHLAYRLHAGSVSMRQLATMTRTHLAILSENLRQHYPALPQTGFAAIADRVDASSTAAAAELIVHLDAAAPSQPQAQAAAYRVGVDNLFYFFYAHLCRHARYDLARDFVTKARRWHAIRRRERLLLNAAPALPVAPAFALSERGEGLKRRLRSQPLARMVPGHDRLTQLAQRIESAAQDPDLSRAA